MKKTFTVLWKAYTSNTFGVFFAVALFGLSITERKLILLLLAAVNAALIYYHTPRTITIVNIVCEECKQHSEYQ